jgi:PilZ domain
MTEQRKSQRFDLRLPFEILGKESAQFEGETMNVSSRGVLFTTPEPVEVGDSIEYAITLPKTPGSRMGVRLRCMGKVVRNDESAAAFAATLERYEFVRGKT